MDWCDVCKYNPPDYSSHEPDKPCGDCWVFGEGNEPSKFVETENRQTNADRIRAMSDAELANALASAETGVNTYGDDVYSHWLSWLKSPVEEVDNG